MLWLVHCNTLLYHYSACVTRGDCMWRRSQSLSGWSTTSTMSLQAFLKVDNRLSEDARFSDIDWWCQACCVYLAQNMPWFAKKMMPFPMVRLSIADTVPPPGILDDLTPDDTRQLVLAEDELATSRRFFTWNNVAIRSAIILILGWMRVVTWLFQVHSYISHCLQSSLLQVSQSSAYLKLLSNHFIKKSGVNIHKIWTADFIKRPLAWI